MEATFLDRELGRELTGARRAGMRKKVQELCLALRLHLGRHADQYGSERATVR